MYKSLVAVAIIATASVPASAETNQTVPATANAAQPAKPQMVKKRVCQQIDEDSYSRLGNRKICKTIEVPVTANGAAANEQAPASTGQSH